MQAVRPYPAYVVIVASVFFVLAVVVAGVGLAGLTGQLPRNRWAGIRTAETLRDDAAFELANKVAAPTMLASAGVLAIGGVAAFAFSGVIAIVAVVVAAFAALVIAGIGGSIATRAVAATAAVGGCGDACGSCSLKDACEK